MPSSRQYAEPAAPTECRGAAVRGPRRRSARRSGHVGPGSACRGLLRLFGLIALAVALRHHLVGDALGQAELDEGLDLVGHHLVTSRLDGGDDVVDVDSGYAPGHDATVPAAPSSLNVAWPATRVMAPQTLRSIPSSARRISGSGCRKRCSRTVVRRAFSNFSHAPITPPPKTTTSQSSRAVLLTTARPSPRPLAAHTRRPAS